MSENTLSRRSLTTSAVWSVPVVVTAVAAPIAAASTTAVDLVVTRSCALVNLFGSLPVFTVSSSTGTVPAGTVLTLRGAALASLDIDTTGVSVGIVSGGTRTYTVTAAAPTVSIEFVGILSAFVAQDFTLMVTSVPSGYSDSNPGNDSASVNLTGTRLPWPLRGFTGICL